MALVTTRNAAPVPRVPTLDAAWAEAEAALPECWRITELRYEPLEVTFQNGRSETYDVWRAEASGVRRGQHAEGLTPIAALQALTAKLRRSKETP